ncbi:transposase family protein [Streptomyces sp. NPDC005151]
MAAPWATRCESALRERRGGERKRAAGAGPHYHLVFINRVLVTLAVLRLQLPHAVLAELYGVSRPTITRAVHEIRPLLAARGFAVPDRPGLRLRTLADVFADAEDVELRIDGTKVQVRRPRAGRPGRKAFVSGKKKQNTAKTTTITDHQGRLLWSGAYRPGRRHDQTAMRTEGITELLRLHPQVKAEVDEGARRRRTSTDLVLARPVTC